MASKYQLRQGLAANWTSNNPTLLSGEIGYETDTGFVKIGDGTTAWTSLAYFTGSFTTPGSSTDNAVVRFSGTSGATIQNSGIIIDDSDNITGVTRLTADVLMGTVTSETSSATPTIDTDATSVHRITALATNVTSFTTNLSGTPTAFQKLIIEVTPTATRTVTWGSSFESGNSHTLPTEFTGTTTVIMGFMYNPATSKWKLVALDA